MKLTEAEELLMHHLWQSGKAFMKDLLEAYPEPKPAPTTVATLLKRMIDKGFVAYREYGNSREYYPLVAKDEYFSSQMKGLISSFFNDSTAQFASFFAQSSNLTTAELEDLKKIIDQQLKQKKP
ncbi:BlaI/MecI/CopY family transcriptional regulator [Telluribacter sp.]|jgi:predicted transcriptional regulator|uniref:BlaI/MecI/CopY family transcriptional regulator n=1 Tax=Telluribacter sp. TaxID=1978767 RepID=UPI002E137DAE|nr:BlaI/MecI/CopY family transcriptional regulator [Telluribacter sp.]